MVRGSQYVPYPLSVSFPILFISLVQSLIQKAIQIFSSMTNLHRTIITHNKATLSTVTEDVL